MLQNKIINSIFKINPNAKVTVRGDDINTCEIEWHNGTTPISKADIEAKYWDKVNGTTNWEDAIAKVKADNPKS